MRKVSYTPFVLLGVVFLFLFSLPKVLSTKIRNASDSFIPLSSVSNAIDQSEMLAAENQRLRSQLRGVQEWLLFDGRFEKQVELYKDLCSNELTNDDQSINPEKDLFLREFFQRRADELSLVLKKKLLSLPAQVVLREPSSWACSLWINVGSKHNESLGKLIVAKNSPVIKGNTLVGVVEEVLHDRARVRLITDSSLVPSVRAVRGNRQDIEIAQQIDSLIDRIKVQKHLFIDQSEREGFVDALFHLKSRLYKSKEDLYLAKGEIRGSYSVSNRKRSSLLKGIGFNYAFSDEEGKAKPLYSEKTPLIKKGDLLVTTGFDGVFPKDLDVAIVTKVYPLKPEDCTYSIDAKSTVGNLDDLSTLYVLPPMVERD